MTILNILNQIASDRSKTHKEAVLKANADIGTLQRVFHLAYQPTVNFFTKVIPEYQFVREEMTLAQALDKLQSEIAGRKVTGRAASDYLAKLLGYLSPDDAEVLKRVVLRDLRVDCGASTANKIWKDCVLDVPYMRCCLPKDTKLANFPWKTGVISQLKSDGSFTNVNVFEDGTVSLMTRNGNEYPLEQFGALVAQFMMNPDARGNQFHGELLVYEGDKLLERAEGNGILNKVAKGGALPLDHEIRFVAWDMIPIAEARPKNKYKVAYKVRLAKLESLGFDPEGCVSVVETRIVYSIREAYEHYQEQLALGLEGTILKHPEAIWEDTTSKNQVKFKLEVVVEMRVTGFNPGKGKNAKTFGSMAVQSECGLVKTNISGMDDKTRQYISDHREEFLDGIVATKSNAMTKVRKDGTRSLFLPVFTEKRDDKSVADTLEQIIAQFENAITDFEKLMGMAA